MGTLVLPLLCGRILVLRMVERIAHWVPPLVSSPRAALYLPSDTAAAHLLLFRRSVPRELSHALKLPPRAGCWRTPLPQRTQQCRPDRAEAETAARRRGEPVPPCAPRSCIALSSGSAILQTPAQCCQACSSSPSRWPC